MSKQSQSTANDLGLLTLRLVVGGLLAGHGAQNRRKLIWQGDTKFG